MSMSFQEALTPEQLELVRAKATELFGEPVAIDQTTLLFNDLRNIEQKRMVELANMVAQPVIVELNAPGEIKTMRDGTKYEVTQRGWKRIIE